MLLFDFVFFKVQPQKEVRKTIMRPKFVPLQNLQGRSSGKNPPVPFRGIKAFCYGAPKVCPDFRGGAKKQPVPWHGGTG